MKGFKGFNAKLQCRDFQFEVGKEYEEKGASCCRNGFHFCENPLEVFSYYPPANSRYCEVEGSGVVDSEGQNDTKVAASQIHIGVEIGLPGLIKAGVEYIKSKVDWENVKETNTRYRSVATNTGDYSAATNTGYQSAAAVEGEDSIACSLGVEGKAKGKKGCWLVLAQWETSWGYRKLLEVRSILVDGDTIKEDTFYSLIEGQVVEVE